MGRATPCHRCVALLGCPHGQPSLGQPPLSQPLLGRPVSLAYVLGVAGERHESLDSYGQMRLTLGSGSTTESVSHPFCCSSLDRTASWEGAPSADTGPVVGWVEGQLAGAEVVGLRGLVADTAPSHEPSTTGDALRTGLETNRNS